jgi:ankyrin repeat protein
MTIYEKLEKAIDNHEDIQALLQQIDLPKCNNRYLLETAFAAKNSKAVIELIERGVDINIELDHGKTPLMEAVDNKDVELVRQLVDRGADTNQTDVGSFTALWYAGFRGDRQIYDYLLPLTSPQFHTDASEQLNLEIIKQKRRENKPVEDFVSAASNGDIKTLLTLIEGGVDINAFNSEGATALCSAILAKQIEVMKLLLDSGANIDLPNEDGMTPLACATNPLYYSRWKGCHINNLENILMHMIDFLIKSGADPNKSGRVIVDVVSSGNLEALQLLINAGVDVNSQDILGTKVLTFAKQTATQEIIQLLRDHGAVE